MANPSNTTAPVVTMVPAVGDLIGFYANGKQYYAEVKVITDHHYTGEVEVNTTGGDEDQSLAEAYAGRPAGTDVWTIEPK